MEKSMLVITLPGEKTMGRTMHWRTTTDWVRPWDSRTSTCGGRTSAIRRAAEAAADLAEPQQYRSRLRSRCFGQLRRSLRCEDEASLADESADRDYSLIMSLTVIPPGIIGN